MESTVDREKAQDPSEIPLLWQYGGHRAIGLEGGRASLPQAAERLIAEPDFDFAGSGGVGKAGGGVGATGRALGVADCEVVLDVERLNVDSASFRQMEDEARAAGEEIAAGVERRVRAIVAARGKLHNPVTGSGGMLLGRVRRVGSALPPPHTGKDGLRVGEQVATLVSLTLTPLVLHEVQAVHLATHQLDVRGSAVVFASGAWARLPAWLPEGVSLAALDVAGAAPQVARLVRAVLVEKSGRAGERGGAGQVERTGTAPRVLVLGCGGKSGLLVAAAARRAGATIVVGVENHPPALADARALGAFSALLSGDAADGLALALAATSAGGGAYDLVVSCVNSPGAEMAAILSCRDRGSVYFFSMATSFTRAALGAEGVGKDIDMLVGNGYCHGHAEETLALLREDGALREIFIRRYG